MGLRSARAKSLLDNQPALQASQKIAAESLAAPNAQDSEFRNMIRQAAQERLGGISSGAQKEQFLTDQARAQSDAIAQARRQLAGTGLSGSLQAGRTFGDIITEGQRQTQRGLLGLQNQELGQLGQVGGIQDALARQGLAEQQLIGNQGLALAELTERQRQFNEAQRQQQQQGSDSGDTAGLLGFGLGMGGGGGIMTGALGSVLGRKFFGRGSLF